MLAYLNNRSKRVGYSQNLSQNVVELDDEECSLISGDASLEKTEELSCAPLENFIPPSPILSLPEKFAYHEDTTFMYAREDDSSDDESYDSDDTPIAGPFDKAGWESILSEYFPEKVPQFPATCAEPFRSEMHPFSLKEGELLLGGMPQRKKRPKGRTRRSQPRAPPDASGIHSRVRVHTSIVPSEFRTRIVFTTTGLTTNAGSRNAGQRYHTNAPYDVDPILGSSASPGFAEIAALYHFVRAIGVKVTLQLLCNEVFPVNVYAIHSNNDLGTGGTVALQQAGNPLCQTIMLAPSGHGGMRTLHSKHTICQVVGSKAPLTDDNYRSLTNSVPADLTWFGFYIDAGPVNTLTVNKGVNFTIRIEMDLLFYGRNILTA